MNLQDILTLYDYNDWANRRILDTAAKVTPEQYAAPNSSSWGSLRGTLIHTLDTEYGWRLRLQGYGPQPDLTDADLPTLKTLEARWDEEQAAWQAYLSNLSDAALQGTIRYEIPGGVRERVIWHCLFHLVNHGMQHRSEAAAMLTDYGHSPGDLDFTLYLNEKAGIK